MNMYEEDGVLIKKDLGKGPAKIEPANSDGVLLNFAKAFNTETPRYFTRSNKGRTSVPQPHDEQQIEKRKKVPLGNSNLDTTVWDRKIHNVDELPIIGLPENECPISADCRQSSASDIALLWHVRMGHASVEYLKALKSRFPDNKELQEAIFDESIRECEICMVAKFN
ncbi:hypothetical protein QAD02_002081 [Eretmocerus hayati]|uniref:Uncharacterized protein n=1 Tax=Eretmocerus hayati TaxID=131215 RepID=A0ACC2NI83_9HYME|nr:hypothetical protein QAD02_002081 [Eretmocerus hayati]